MTCKRAPSRRRCGKGWQRDIFRLHFWRDGSLLSWATAHPVISCPCRIAVNGRRSAAWWSCFICFMKIHEAFHHISPMLWAAILDKRRGFLWCGLWMTLDPWKSRENIAQILLESFLGSVGFGIAASNSILLKKWSFTMWQAWQHGT